MSRRPPDELRKEARVEWARLQALPQPLTPRDRLAIPCQEMPAQESLARAQNMQEVTLGYSDEQARVEAERCLQCRNAPCVQGCPVRIQIPQFIAALAAGNPARAIAIIRETSLLPAVCGRVCPQEMQCQAHCTVGKSLKSVDQAVAIGRLERYAADWERTHGAVSPPVVAPATGKKVAVVGSGPAGITVAADVRRAGHEVVLFEAFHKAGGVLVYGIPEFRLPKTIVQAELDALQQMGVTIRTNFVVGRTRKITDLITKDGFDAVFVGSGAGLPKFMEIEGENLVGVYSANEYLTRSNLMKAYDRERAETPIPSARRVAVLGGGNVAMDAARTALRLGAQEVHLIYRRTEVEMPARAEEVRHAKEEGVRIHVLQNAKRILGANGHVTGIECLRHELGDPDSSGRRRSMVIPDSEFQLPIEAVIVAIGNQSNPLIKQTTEGLDVDQWGRIVTDQQGHTSLPNVFAGGDIVLGTATVILAMGEGRRAAAAINEMLQQENSAGVPARHS
ncbi:MAG: NADPH-dependent glutamate synthase [Kiritimatiellae bacterium]|nr:NADPH-dependent glutamate synthase [Kiritimatiellia bacterium]MDY0149478.1 NADPH-dependent glutamate synthase [Kiritimatiellia bacterium]